MFYVRCGSYVCGVPSLFSALPGGHVAQTGDRHGQNRRRYTDEPEVRRRQHSASDLQSPVPTLGTNQSIVGPCGFDSYRRGEGWRRRLSGLVSPLFDEPLDGDVDELVLQVGLHEARSLLAKTLDRPEYVDLGVQTCPRKVDQGL